MRQEGKFLYNIKDVLKKNLWDCKKFSTDVAPLTWRFLCVLTHKKRQYKKESGDKNEF